MAMPPLSVNEIKGQVHAAIITIRLDEYAAMEGCLGETRAVVGVNTYKYAILEPDGAAPVSVALTRIVGQGNSRAQAAASNIIHELDPSWLILVGIAGGVPDYEYSLGDVIVATYLHDFSLTAASAGEVTFQAQGGAMHRDVERFLSTRAAGSDGERLRALAGFTGDGKLMSHPAVYSPKIPKKELYYGSKSHQDKVRQTIEKRFPNEQREGGPLAWQGPCANGDVLMKDADLLKQWQASARQTSHVETELSGVYEAARTAGRENYPVLAIRGLSDIVGFKRDPTWTGYACETAAAYTRAVLQSGFIDFESNLPNP